MSKNNRKRKRGSVQGSVLQALQPRPIQVPSYRVGNELKHHLEAILSLVKQGNPEANKHLAEHSQAVRQYEKILQKQMNVIASVCTGLWRMQQNLSQVPIEEMPDKVRRLNRHLESIMDTLTQSDFAIKDHLREAYDPGMFLNVAAYEPTDGISRETIIETIKPSVYWEDKCIQNGEVIVGTPKKSESSGMG